MHPVDLMEQRSLPQSRSPLLYCSRHDRGKYVTGIMMKFFVVSLPKDGNDIVTRSEFYVNDSPVPLASYIRFGTHIPSKFYCFVTFQLSNIYICYETSYNRIVDLNSRTSLLVIVPGYFKNICFSISIKQVLFLK